MNKYNLDFLWALTDGKMTFRIAGSQLIAEVLGAKVYPNKQKEIGWFDVKQTETGENHPMLKGIEHEFTVFHWHGDTYDLPPKTEHLFYTDVCKHQAFIFDKRVLGLQFHFEVTKETLNGMVVNGKNELMKDKTVQTAEEIIAADSNVDSNNLKMYKILDNLNTKN